MDEDLIALIVKVQELEECINILKDKVEELEGQQTSDNIPYLEKPPERK